MIERLTPNLHITATIQDVTGGVGGQAILLHESTQPVYTSESIFRRLAETASLLPDEMRMSITVEKSD